MLIYMWVKSQY